MRNPDTIAGILNEGQKMCASFKRIVTRYIRDMSPDEASRWQERVARDYKVERRRYAQFYGYEVEL